MTWNYRVLKYIDDPDPANHYYELHEMYYPVAEDGKPDPDPDDPSKYEKLMWTTEGTPLHGETQQEIIENVTQQAQAFGRAIVLIKDEKVVGLETWESAGGLRGDDQRQADPPTR